eukprot:2356997-Prymnesium_polylepis.1
MASPPPSGSAAARSQLQRGFGSGAVADDSTPPRKKPRAPHAAKEGANGLPQRPHGSPQRPNGSPPVPQRSAFDAAKLASRTAEQGSARAGASVLTAMCHGGPIGSGPLNRPPTSAPSHGVPPAASSKPAASPLQPFKASPPGAASGVPRAAETLCEHEHDLVQALKSLKRGRAEDV